MNKPTGGRALIDKTARPIAGINGAWIGAAEGRTWEKHKATAWFRADPPEGRFVIGIGDPC